MATTVGFTAANGARVSVVLRTMSWREQEAMASSIVADPGAVEYNTKHKHLVFVREEKELVKSKKKRHAVKHRKVDMNDVEE